MSRFIVGDNLFHVGVEVNPPPMLSMLSCLCPRVLALVSLMLPVISLTQQLILMFKSSSRNRYPYLM
jgi:hypothetical protein